MVYGTRTAVPLGLGCLVGIFLGLIFLPNDDSLQQRCLEKHAEKKEFIDVAGDWEVHVKKPVPLQYNQAQPSGKVVRARFAATELGMREKLIVIILGQSTLSVALNASIGHHVPRVHVFADSSRIDADMSALSNLSPYRPNGQHAHVHILNAIFNMTLHENYDWFFFVPDTTYVNPFELLRLVNGINWNLPLAVGYADSEGKCNFQAGILLSNPAVQSLIQQRHSCSSIAAASDHSAFEMCIRHATNLSCVPSTQGQDYRWWRAEDNGETGSAVHERVRWFSASREFNSSMTVSPLVSEMDARSLHEHFVHVELEKIDGEIGRLSVELDEFSYDVEEGPSWPVGLPPTERPPNRYQVPVWEYFTETEIFKNEPNQNVRSLVGSDALDIREVIAFARDQVENHGLGDDDDLGEKKEDGSFEFSRLRSGYRTFNAQRGMEYVLDLEYRRGDQSDPHARSQAPLIRRVHLCRPIHLTQLLHQVPYVKEDTDITIVVPVGRVEELRAARTLLARHVKLCTASESLVDSRQTRIVVAVRSVDASSIRDISNDLLDLKKRCKSWQTETALLLLKSNANTMLETAAMDEAVDHYGQQMIYVLMSPYADYQREFLDRVRINTIRHFQVFMPVPFAEFHPMIVSADHILNAANGHESPASKNVKEDLQLPADLKLQGNLAERLRQLNAVLPSTDSVRPIVVHKDRGLFDVNDFSVIAFYGSDYSGLRPRLASRSADDPKLMDLSSMFLGQSELHLMRAVEPALRVRHHHRQCSAELASSDLLRCQLSQKQTLGSKSQLATLVFSGADAA